MGSFSWLFANGSSKYDNICYGMEFKCLIPKEFGGGYIKDFYQDYGLLGRKSNGEAKYDMYELLAFWNHDYIFKGNSIEDELLYNEELPKLKEIDGYTDNNRLVGIDIGCGDKEMSVLKYPLKLVTGDCTLTYEECKNFSEIDENQGSSYEDMYDSY